MSLFALWLLGVIRTEIAQVAMTVSLAITVCIVFGLRLTFIFMTHPYAYA